MAGDRCHTHNTIITMLIYAVTSETTDLSMGFPMTFNKKYHSFHKYERGAKESLKQDYEDDCHDFAGDDECTIQLIDDSSYKLEFHRNGKVTKSTTYRVESFYCHE